MDSGALIDTFSKHLSACLFSFTSIKNLDTIMSIIRVYIYNILNLHQGCSANIKRMGNMEIEVDGNARISFSCISILQINLELCAPV